MLTVRTRWQRIGLLGMLYLVQGLPFGFQVSALPIYLRDQGVSLTVIGFSTALALPWALKFLWAPLLERYGGRRGQRKRWIVPLQLLMALGFLGASRLSPETDLDALMGVLLGLNLLAATQDIAVDGWAVDILGPTELGPGNAAQVVGYKVGMLLAGGVLVWATGFIGWGGAFTVMAGIVGGVALLVSRVKEDAATATEQVATESVGAIVAALRAAMLLPGTGWILACVATYKMGESLIDVMYKPFLLDAGFTAAELGLWLGTWGMGASLLGSAVGGWVAMRTQLVRALLVAGLVRLLPEVLQLLLAAGVLPLDATMVIGVTLAEHLAGGVLTTVMFASMMGWVDRRIGATHFTVLSCVEVWGKSGAAFFSGWIAEQLGYTGAFALGLVLGVGFLVLVVELARRHPDSVTARYREGAL